MIDGVWYAKTAILNRINYTLFWKKEGEGLIISGRSRGGGAQQARAPLKKGVKKELRGAQELEEGKV